ncbi:MAG: DUF6783 domain-containing protein [Lachnospiraceae bacterium]
MKSTRACLKKAFRELRVSVCGRFYPHSVAVALVYESDCTDLKASA